MHSSGSGRILDIDEEDIPRYPPFAKGMPVAPVDRVMATQAELVERIRMALGFKKKTFIAWLSQSSSAMRLLSICYPHQRHTITVGPEGCFVTALKWRSGRRKPLRGLSFDRGHTA